MNNFFRFLRYKTIGKPVRDGRWVGECWITREIGRGSTLYRERFNSRDDAYAAVRYKAMILDWELPESDFGINYGVRLACEHDDHYKIWSPFMPGHPEFTGEHSSHHPLSRKK